MVELLWLKYNFEGESWWGLSGWLSLFCLNQLTSPTQPLRLKRAVCIFLFTVCAMYLPAQWFVGVKFMGVTVHTDNNFNGHLYKTAIGKHHRIAFHFGLALTCEYKFNDWLSVKADQSLFRDCAGKMAGMTMINARYTINFRNGSDLSGGLGPFWYYRRSWFSIDGYKDDGYFKLSSDQKWQKKFIWYGGEIEYNFPINDKLDWSTNLFPGVPVVLAFASGVRTKIR